MTIKENPLGKQQAYDQEYSPDILFPIARDTNRKALTHVPILGCDLWNAYEFSWLNSKHHPHAEVLRIHVASDSINIVESKSLKLYLNTFAFKVFESREQLQAILLNDLKGCIKGDIKIELLNMSDERLGISSQLSKDAILLDSQLVEESFNTESFESVIPECLLVSKRQTQGVINLYTNLFRSVCPVTQQPDWASIVIRYKGLEIETTSLFRYLLSFRKHAGFHEDCVEKIYSDLINYCTPEKLSVYAAFTRRGGIEINPFRSNFENDFYPGRLARQ